MAEQPALANELFVKWQLLERSWEKQRPDLEENKRYLGKIEWPQPWPFGPTSMVRWWFGDMTLTWPGFPGNPTFSDRWFSKRSKASVQGGPSHIGLPWGIWYLVNVYIAMENHHFSWENPLCLWPFLIAMLVITRGYLQYPHFRKPPGISQHFHQLGLPWGWSAEYRTRSKTSIGPASWSTSWSSGERRAGFFPAAMGTLIHLNNLIWIQWTCGSCGFMMFYVAQTFVILLDMRLWPFVHKHPRWPRTFHVSSYFQVGLAAGTFYYH